MQQHNTDSGHPIVFSFADFSKWCYTCEDYVVHPLLDHHRSSATPEEATFFQQKFGSEGDNGHAVMQKIKDSKYEAVIPEE
jgi:hypothetical protein